MDHAEFSQAFHQSMGGICQPFIFSKLILAVVEGSFITICIAYMHDR